MKKLTTLAAGLTLLAAAGANAADEPKKTDTKTDARIAAALAAPATREFTIVAVQLEKAKFWLPSSIIVKKGEHVKLTLKNMIAGDAAKPESLIHGFAIDELNVTSVVKSGADMVVEFDATKAGLFRMYCQLHAAHIGGQLLVIE